MPRVLQTVAWWSRPIAFQERCRARYGKRFTVRLLGQSPFVVLTDPEEIKQIFQAPADVLHPGEGAYVLEPVVGRIPGCSASRSRSSCAPSSACAKARAWTGCATGSRRSSPSARALCRSSLRRSGCSRDAGRWRSWNARERRPTSSSSR
jgi:hypothetical protein